MKLKLAPENLLERIALMLNLAPTPLVETQIAFTAARAIMAGSVLGIFDALGKESRTSDQVSADCKTHPEATRQLLDCLTGIGYVKCDKGCYALKPRYHKWLLKTYPSNLAGKMRFQLTEWDWMAKLEDYVRSGHSLEMHSMTDPAIWANYQDGMRDLSVNAAKEVAGKLRLSPQASAMLDIGGSHGLYSIELCRKNPNLSSTILELPGAMDRASAIATEQGLTDRVKFRQGNALTDDLGDQKYDLVLINNVVHHFTVPQNIELAQKIFRALKPGGMYAVGEIIRNNKPGEGGAVAAATGLYFSMTSQSGTWSVEDIHSWQEKAGLQLQKSISLLTIPGFKIVIASKLS